MKVENFIRNIPDFPAPGINFKDITPLLNNPEATKKALQNLLFTLRGEKIDKVAGIEARGFFFGTLLARELNAGFVPIRKRGKLPFKTVSEAYDLEYGKDTLEIHEDAILKGEKVLLHDDVLATGGTAAAAVRLIEKLGGEVVQCNFLIELSFLNGREKLKEQELFSLLKY